nr:chemotaxis response regulator protein-glutamate methylesterase [Pseudomonas aeruginosa]
MAVKVLVVDDSGFFRRRVSEILSADGQIQVVGTATNGREAIEQALALRPDVITIASAGASPAPASTSAAPKRKAYRLVAIGTSTGGPVALQRVLTQLPANFPAPLVLIQHMPAAFTKAFAERLDKLCRISVKEAEDGDILRPGLALLAPGGKQMMVDGRGTVRILPGDERLNYKPCVDVTFGSAAKAYNDKVLAVVLTGMGADGREGARLLKQGGSQVWAQDEASCVIYGMPMAVVKANLADAVYGLDDIGRHLVEACQ